MRCSIFEEACSPCRRGWWLGQVDPVIQVNLQGTSDCNALIKQYYHHFQLKIIKWPGRISHPIPAGHAATGQVNRSCDSIGRPGQQEDRSMRSLWLQRTWRMLQFWGKYPINHGFMISYCKCITLNIRAHDTGPRRCMWQKVKDTTRKYHDRESSNALDSKNDIFHIILMWFSDGHNDHTYFHALLWAN